MDDIPIDNCPPSVKLITFSLCMIAVLFFVTHVFAASTVTPPIEPVLISSTIPIRISIPAIRIDAPIEMVSIMSDNTLGNPKEPTQAGWFSAGIRPGEVGSAIIDGHFGWVNKKPAVFDALSSLQVGDSVYITDQAQRTLVFIVREVRTYHAEGDTFEVFNSKDGKAHLNLITCTGAWNKTLQSYTDRLVVMSDLQTSL